MLVTPVTEKIKQLDFYKLCLAKYDVIAVFLTGSQQLGFDTVESDYDVVILVNDATVKHIFYPTKFKIFDTFVHFYVNGLYWWDVTETDNKFDRYEISAGLAKMRGFSYDVALYVNQNHRLLFESLVRYRDSLAKFGAYLLHDCTADYWLENFPKKLTKQAYVYIYSAYQLAGESISEDFLLKLKTRFNSRFLEFEEWRNEIFEHLHFAYDWFTSHPIDVMKLRDYLREVLYV